VYKTITGTLLSLLPVAFILYKPKLLRQPMQVPQE
jgi:hypothetical protein